MKGTSKAAVGKSEGEAKSSNVSKRGNKQANKALRDNEALYRKTLDNMLEGCQILGHDWRYL